MQRYFLSPRAVFAPSILSATAIGLTIWISGWFLLSLPLIWLASSCAQPNLNLINGCLAYVGMIIGFVLLAWHKPAGTAVLFGTMAGFYLSAIEKWVRAEPVREAKMPHR